MTSGGGAFFDQFIEDYFAECDEHLATVRRVLLALEEGVAGEAPDPRLSRDLLRGLHTLKGLSGMVGDARAERVAHALEDAVRAGERVGEPPAHATLDALFAGVDLLERCIAAHRAGAAPPAIDATVAALGRVGAGEVPALSLIHI